ncbi:type II toxin-antitoxin system RelB/DinJ family antitoxin [Patescibacteria group bacterium]|nr:type II toxin-antitoxin system RelB/DinJ family antitoxin [Patescibacteria group bacterium]
MKTVINIKTDKEVKENAQKVAEELGLTLSAIVNASLKQFIRTREVYFSTLPKMTLDLEKLAYRTQKDYEIGQNISPSFASAKDALDYLHSK